MSKLLAKRPRDNRDVKDQLDKLEADERADAQKTLSLLQERSKQAAIGNVLADMNSKLQTLSGDVPLVSVSAAAAVAAPVDTTSSEKPEPPTKVQRVVAESVDLVSDAASDKLVSEEEKKLAEALEKKKDEERRLKEEREKKKREEQNERRRKANAAKSAERKRAREEAKKQAAEEYAQKCLEEERSKLHAAKERERTQKLAAQQHAMSVSSHSLPTSRASSNNELDPRVYTAVRAVLDSFAHA